METKTITKNKRQMMKKYNSEMYKTLWKEQKRKRRQK